MKQAGMKILLGQDLWQDDLVATLVSLGHTVTPVSLEFDVMFSHKAWRIPPGSTPEELMKYIDMVLKQVRLTNRVENPPQEKGVATTPKSVRKRAAKKKPKDTGTTEPVEPRADETPSREATQAGSGG